MQNQTALIITAFVVCLSCAPEDKKSTARNPPDNPELVKLPIAWPNGDEATMVNFRNRPLIK